MLIMGLCMSFKACNFNARSHVQINGQYSEEFGVGVGVHQGILSRLGN